MLLNYVVFSRCGGRFYYVNSISLCATTWAEVIVFDEIVLIFHWIVFADKERDEEGVPFDFIFVCLIWNIRTIIQFRKVLLLCCRRRTILLKWETFKSPTLHFHISCWVRKKKEFPRWFFSLMPLFLLDFHSLNSQRIKIKCGFLFLDKRNGCVDSHCYVK